MNKTDAAKGTVFLSRSLVAGLVLLGLMAVSVAGCAGKGATTEPVPQKQSSKPDQGQKKAAQQASQEQTEPRPEPAVGIKNVGDKTLVTIPVAEDVQVTPSYAFPRLKLSFSPGLQGSSYSLDPEDDLLSRINQDADPETAGISNLHFQLKQPIQFLISRPSPRQVRVLLVPKTRQAEANNDQVQDSPSGMSSLTDIDFTTNKQGTLFIKLFSDRSIKYYSKSETDQQLAFVFPETKIPGALAKLYRLRKFDGPIKSALLQNTAEGGMMRLSMTKRVPINIDRSGTSLVLAFRSQPGQTASSNDQPHDRPDPMAMSTGGNQTDGQAQPLDAENRQVASSEDPLPGESNTPLFPGMKEDYTGQPISIDLQDADIEHVLRLIGQVAGYNLILDENVSGTISLKLENVPWDQALDLVLLQKDLGMVKRGNILRIATAQQLEKEHQRVIQARKAALEAQKSRQELAPLTTEYIQINYTTAGQLQPQVQKFLSKRGQVSQDSRTNQLIVSDTPSHIQKIKSVIRKLDRPERQVLIEARVVFATDSFQRGLGLRWGGGYDSEHQGGEIKGGVYGTQGSITPTTGVDETGFAINVPTQALTTLGVGGYISKLMGTDLFTIDAQLDLGESKGLVKTISSPRIVTLNNQKAQMTQGTMIATKAESESGGTTTEYVEAVLDLSVTPQITPNNKLILDLDISDDSPVPGGEDIETRTAKTKLIVDNGETIVIGGVQQVTETRNERKVPGVGEIPLLGWLFKSKFNNREKRELLIFIRPKII